ncbi:MAG: flippase-like domain-containing protein [Actinomycetota bacterium]|nr:flippase-like domain-containing protein [Actinomycetota bacterium]
MDTGEVATAPRPGARSLTARIVSRTWKTALALAVVSGGWWTAAHGVAGVAWGDVVSVLRGVAPWQLGLLAGIWLGGLCIYATVLSAAMPGLGLRRSLLLNLSGSAVANVFPLGGAVATALNWRMVRKWGHSNGAFVSYCVLTNALDVLTKLVLPLVGVAALVVLSVHVPTVLWAVAGSCAVLLLVGLAVLQVQTSRVRPDRGAESHESADQRWHSALRRHLRDSGGRIRSLLALRWPRLLPASAGYIAAQVALLFFSLRAVGLVAPVTVVLMAAAIERLGSLIPLTPGGTGVAEVGTIAWLVASGLDPVEAVAGVLLYRVFLVAMEVPLGGLLLGGWAWLQRASASNPSGEVAV